MKALVFTLLMLAPTLALAARPSAGTVEIGASLGPESPTWHSSDPEPLVPNAFAMRLAGFWYVTPHLGVGAVLGRGDERRSEDVISASPDAPRITLRSHGTSLVAGPAFALDVPIASIASAFLHMTVGYERATLTGGERDVRFTGWAGAVVAGARCFVRDWLAIGAGVRYDRRWLSVHVEQLSTNARGGGGGIADARLGVELGLAILFGP